MPDLTCETSVEMHKEDKNFAYSSHRFYFFSLILNLLQLCYLSTVLNIQ